MKVAVLSNLSVIPCKIILFCTSDEGRAAVVFPWGCTNYSGVCRPMCLPTELPFGPFGCAKGFVCCVSHIIL
uniref:Beta-defensin n=1 Tax=Pygocentrus nattereri TaxID=42514 RepID=A0AAR2L9N6_PYGNA